MKVWFLTKMTALCNLALSYSDGSDDQEEVNGVIATKNYFIKELDKYSK